MTLDWGLKAITKYHIPSVHPRISWGQVKSSLVYSSCGLRPHATPTCKQTHSTCKISIAGLELGGACTIRRPGVSLLPCTIFKSKTNLKPNIRVILTWVDAKLVAALRLSQAWVRVGMAWYSNGTWLPLRRRFRWGHLCWTHHICIIWKKNGHSNESVGCRGVEKHR